MLKQKLDYDLNKDPGCKSGVGGREEAAQSYIPNLRVGCGCG